MLHFAAELNSAKFLANDLKSHCKQPFTFTRPKAATWMETQSKNGLDQSERPSYPYRGFLSLHFENLAIF